MANPTVETFDMDDLIAGDYPVQTTSVTVVSGQNVVRGTVMGRITSGGKYAASVRGTASDGSEVAVGIIAVDCDASGGDKTNVPLFVSGEFNTAHCTLPGTHTQATVNTDIINAGGQVFLVTPYGA